MRLLLVAPTVVLLGTERYGGIEKLLVDFAVGLLARGHQVTIAAPRGSIVPGCARLIETVRLPDEQDRDDIAAAAVRTAIGFDAVHDFSHLHALARSEPQPKALFHIWSPVVRRYPVAHYNVVAISDWQRERFERVHDQRAVTVRPLVDTRRFRPLTDGRRERFLFLGAIVATKGVHLAIALARAAGVPLDVVGGLVPSEHSSPYLRHIASLCDGTDVRLFFNVTESEKLSFLRRARAVLYPVQQDEAGWLAGLEAWACGTPTIALNRGAMKSILPEVQRLSCVVDTMPEFLDRMSSIGDAGEGPTFTEWIEKTYSVDGVLPSYEQLYEQVSRGVVWS
jgi:glycosyltransferase involved in cell wall biosynthesis